MESIILDLSRGSNSVNSASENIKHAVTDLKTTMKKTYRFKLNCISKRRIKRKKGDLISQNCKNNSWFKYSVRRKTRGTNTQLEEEPKVQILS